MPLPLYQVNAFTDDPFGGNPAAICLLASPMADSWMQRVAAQINLSETAFVLDTHIRWFTPAIEVDLCGHATLAAAHVLWESGAVPHTEPIPFTSRSGLLPARRRGAFISLDFPSDAPSPCDTPQGLEQALGVELGQVFRGRFDLLVEVPNQTALENVRPDLRALTGIDCRGVTVTAPADADGIDFCSRFFAPAAGIDEDPVTGSAHCVLGPYWQAKLERAELTGYQCSSRGGTVRIRMNGERVALAGKAVTVLKGVLLADGSESAGFES